MWISSPPTVVSFVIISRLGHFLTLPPQPTSVLLTFVVVLMRNVALFSQMSAQTKSSVVLLQLIRASILSSDTKTLNVIFRAVYYDQQLHFISSVWRSCTLSSYSQ